MDNTIPPITPPNMNNPTPDKVVSGEIENLPEPIKAIKPSESLLLNILMKSDALASSTLNATIKAEVNQKPVEIPIELKLDSKLDLPRDVQNQVSIKVMGQENGNLSFKLISINNEKPGRFVAINEPTLPLSNQALSGNAPTSQTSLSSGQTLVSSQIKAEKPLIFDTTTSVKQAEVHPFDFPPLVNKLAQNSGLPKPIIDTLVNGFKDVKINVKLSQVVDANIVSNKQVSPNPQFNQLSDLNIPIQNSMERVQLILDNFAQNAKNASPSLENIQDVVNQIKTEVIPFKNTSLAGDAITLQDKQVVAIKTPIGNFLLETPLKIVDTSKFILDIKEISFPNKSPHFALTDLVPSQKLIEDLIDLRPLIGNASGAVKPAPATLHKILELFHPLKEIGRQDLSAKIMAKMPSLNDKMLPNMVSFIKGSMNRNLGDWLGREIMDDLSKSGFEGKEVASRLNNFMSANNREGISWRMVEIPFFNGDTMSKIRIAIKKFTEEDEENTKLKKSKYGTRFVVDTSFTKLGEFQFDGFSLAKEKRFDLIIRTSQVIGEDLCSNIMRIFKNTLNDVSYVGNVKINIKENFIKVCDDEHNETLKDGIYI